MKIRRVFANSFRNYKECSLDIDSMINVFYGKNAQGKTNLLEIIFYGAFGLSHRTFQEDELFNENSRQLAVGIIFENQHGLGEVKIKKINEFEKKKKEFYLNNNKTTAKNYYGTLCTVMFSPEDLQLVKGDPALRRRFLDMEISQIDKLYYALLVKYGRVLQQRNKLLKEIRDAGRSAEELGLWDKELSKIAAQIVIKRMEVLKKSQKIAQHIYASIAGANEVFTVRYEMKGNNNSVIEVAEQESIQYDKYIQLLTERRNIDILRGSTGIGPHRDDILFFVNDRSLKAFGSQGQQRSAALTMKLTQLEFFKDELGEYPVLLLDDVMSELDEERRGHLLTFINEKIQTFITVNEKALIPFIGKAAYYHITNGKISRG